MKDYKYEMNVRIGAIVENYNLGLYQDVRSAITDGVKFGLELAQKVYEEPTPEEENLYQGRIYG